MKNNVSSLVVLFLLSLVVCFAYPKYPEIPSPAGANYLWDDTNKVWRPVAGGDTGVQSAGAVSVTIGSTTFNSDPVWSDSSGSGTLALVDSYRRAMVNLASDTADTASQSIYLVTSSDYVIPTFLNRKYIQLSASGTFEYVVGTSVVPANTDPCYNAAFECGPNMPVAVKTTATNTYLTIRHFGRAP